VQAGVAQFFHSAEKSVKIEVEDGAGHGGIIRFLGEGWKVGRLKSAERWI
jgi:hypothetical protein